MDKPRPDDPQAVAERLVAWHNRHPLARRLSASQVQSVGYVAVPFLPAEGTAAAPGPSAAAPRAAPAAGGGGLSLRERALARAQQGDAAGDPGAAAGAAGTSPARPAKARRAEAAARPSKGPLPRPAFTEDFIAPLKPRQVARWLARQGVADPDLARGVPVRQVAADPERAPRKSDVQTLYALTAMVEVGGQRIRPLLSLADPAAVLGTRLWSAARVSAAAGVTSGLLMAAGATAWWWPAEPPPDLQAGAQPTAPLPAASAVFPSIKPQLAPLPPRLPPPVAELATMPAAATPAQGATPLPDGAGPASPAAAPGQAAVAAAPAGAAVSPPATAAAGHAADAAGLHGSPAAVRPVDVEPTLGRVELPGIGLPRPDRARPREAAPALTGVSAPAQPVPVAGAAAPAAPDAAAAGGRGVAAGPAAAPPVPAAQLPPGAAGPRAAPGQPPADAHAAAPGAMPAPASPPAAAAAAAGPPVFALSTRLLRTRAESELTMAAMKSLLLTAGYRDVQVEVMPVGEDWRVVSWPFVQRAQAEKARGLLASRGMRLDVVDF